GTFYWELFQARHYSEDNSSRRIITHSDVILDFDSDTVFIVFNCCDYVDGRPAGFGQNITGAPSADDFASALAGRGAGSDEALPRRGLAGARPEFAGRTPVPHAASHRRPRRFGRRRLVSASRRDCVGA